MRIPSLRRGEELLDKKLVRGMVRDFEDLLNKFEMIAERESMIKIRRRLVDVKKKKVKGYSEKDFRRFLKKKGIKIE